MTEATAPESLREALERIAAILPYPSNTETLAQDRLNEAIGIAVTALVLLPAPIHQTEDGWLDELEKAALFYASDGMSVHDSLLTNIRAKDLRRLIAIARAAGGNHDH